MSPDQNQNISITDELLRDFVLGKLDGELAEQVERFLESSPDAWQRISKIEADAFIRNLQQAAVETPSQPVSTPNREFEAAPPGKESRARYRGSSDNQSKDQHVKPSIAPPLSIPSELAACSQYRIIRELGAGGMGVVFLAENLDMGGRLEALKVMNDAQLREPAARKRFEQEVKAVAGLNHPNIVTAYSVLKLPSTTVVFAMEYVDGEDLDKIVRNRGPLTIADACGIIRHVAKGLDHAFEENRIHRDIKPSNLILAKSGKVVKILDFGLAKARGEGDADRLTSTNMRMGTPQYMAPEQFFSTANVDIRADIYSLGCTLYFLLTGTTPFTGSNFADFRAYMEREPPQLNLVRPDVPIELSTVVSRMLAMDPAKRYQRPRDVVVALAQFLSIRSKARPKVALRVNPPGDTDPPRSDKQSTILRLMNTPPGSTLSTEIESVSRLGPEASSNPLRSAGPTESFSAGRTPNTTLSIFAGANRRTIVTASIIGLALLGWIVWASVLLVKTANGIIVLQQLPNDANVLVDGERVSVRWDDDRSEATIEVKPGTRIVEVQRNGITVEGQTVTISSGQEKQLVVGFLPDKGEVRTDSSETDSASSTDGLVSRTTGMEFALMPAGQFEMGSPNDESDRHNDERQYRVRITKPFYLAKHEVTQSQFEQVMQYRQHEPSRFNDGNRSRLPVNLVTWFSAIEFCNRLSESDGRTPVYRLSDLKKKGDSILGATVTWQEGNGYRLPTEAEWEYACRSGTTTPFSFGQNLTTDEANYDGNFPYSGAGKGVFREKPTSIGTLQENRWGLFDMHGNVFEWCWDWYGSYPHELVENPTGPFEGNYRVIRGGCWKYCTLGNHAARAIRSWKSVHNFRWWGP